MTPLRNNPLTISNKKSNNSSKSPKSSKNNPNGRETQNNDYLHKFTKTKFSPDSIRRVRKTRLDELISSIDSTNNAKNATWKKPISAFKYHVSQVRNDETAQT